MATFRGELHDVSVDGSGLSVRLASSTGPFVGADVSLSTQDMHIHARVAYVLLDGGQLRMGVSVGAAGQARVRAVLAAHVHRQG